jgi:hypothetical protein
MRIDELAVGEIDDVKNFYDFNQGGLIISSNDESAKKAAQFFITNNRFIEEERWNISSLKDGQTLMMICHDHEFENQQHDIIKALSDSDFPMSNFKIAMLVCSAAEKTCEDGVTTFAQKLADTLKREVVASATNVTFDGSFTEYHGHWTTVSPTRDLEHDPELKGIIKSLSALTLAGDENVSNLPNRSNQRGGRE